MDRNNSKVEEISYSIHLLQEVAEQLKTLSEVAEIVLELARCQLKKEASK